MTVSGGPSGQRGVALWRELFRIYRQRQVPPPASAAPRVTATQQDLAEILLNVALAFDELLTTGALPPGRAEQSMLALLLVRDQAVPLPVRLAGSISTDFQEIIAVTRQLRGEGDVPGLTPLPAV